MREIVIQTLEEHPVPVAELNKLRKEAFREQWAKEGLRVDISDDSSFAGYLKEKVVFVAHDAATGELLAMHTLKLNKKKGSVWGANLAVASAAKQEGIASRMLRHEVKLLRQRGYRYFMGTTGIPATWSVQWHLKNGYYIVGYSRSEKQNYASYVFRKQIALDIRHHPTDLLWTKPLAPITAKLRYWATYVATCICKDKAGRLNWIGRMARPTPDPSRRTHPRPLPKGGEVR